MNTHNVGLLHVSLLLLFVTACEGGEVDDDGSGGGSATVGSTGAGAVCYDVPVNDATDGSAACGPEICGAGSYCFATVGICRPGCLSELDCAGGEECDLSNATPNENGDPVGLCARPGPEHEVPCSNEQPRTCASRCAGKATLCRAPNDDLCDALCAQSPSSDQLDCIEQTSCMELGEAFENGTPFCGVGG